MKFRIFFSNAGPAAPQHHSLPVTVTLGVPQRSTQPPLQARPFAAASRSRFRKRSVLVAATKNSGLCPGLASRRPFLPAKPLPHNATEENSPVSAKYAYATLSFPFAYFASEVRAKENPPGRPRSSVQDSLSRSFSHVPQPRRSPAQNPLQNRTHQRIASIQTPHRSRDFVSACKGK